MKRLIFAVFLIFLLNLASCGDKADKTTDIGNNKVTEESTSENPSDKPENGETVPDLAGKSLDDSLQSELMSKGFLLKITNEYSDTVLAGNIISQSPEAGTVCKSGGTYLELCVSLGAKDGNVSDGDTGKTDGNVPDSDTENTDSDIHVYPQDPTKDIGGTAPTSTSIRWLSSPRLSYDEVYTFGMTGYSVYRKGDSYGVIDLDGRNVGEGTYTNLFYCPEHGLSSSDVTQVTEISDGLSVSPDCGYRAGSDGNIYVYDNLRARVYLTGMSDGKFRIVDITDTEFFKSNEHYIAVLYNCDADLMMYEDAGMSSLAEIFEGENREMKYGVISSRLEHIVSFVYDSVVYGNDCYIVEQNGKFGYRGTSGQHYYPCVFQKANTAYKGAAWVKYGGKWGTVAF
ncbi:MAG: PASTA domain-containing protein [Clostridia bacterium]|nr:PASTA domain-containing protein [Clostridia bacterium]